MVEQRGEFAIRSLLNKKRWISHNLIVSQKLRASTSKKWSLYRTVLGNVQIIDYSRNYCLIPSSCKVSHYGMMGSCTAARRRFSFITLFHQKRWDSGFSVRRWTLQMGYKKGL